MTVNLFLSLNGTWNETEGHGDYTFGPPDDPAALPGGWRLNIPMLQANVHTILTPGPTNSACYKNFMVVTADGSSHTFANIAGCATTLKNSPFTVTPDNASNSTTATADDLPVLLLDTSNPADYVLRGKDGTSFHFFANFGLATASLTTPPVIDADPVFKLPDEIVDANGNIITITNSNGNLIFTDNAGRVVTLTYGSLPPNWSSVLNSVSYLDSSGVQRTITLSYSNFSFNYTLAQPQNLGGALSTSGTIPFLSSVTYPNGLSYNFQYEHLLVNSAAVTDADAATAADSSRQLRPGATTTYVYDAGGRRVRKSVVGVTTDYVYNLGGTVTEVNSAGVWSRTEIYAGGKHLATYAGGVSGTTYFNHTDWLGTERVRSDMTGAACETVTSLIFGDDNR